MNEPHTPSERPKRAGATSDPAPPRTVASAELLRGSSELLIRHGDELYRLRLTRNGKLILHK